MLLLKFLYEILEYDPWIGNFIWRINKGQRGKVGQIAGNKHKSGYWHIKINSKIYKAHILAWYYMFGEWPILDIDHENTTKDDNRFINLRLATESQNCANRLKNKNNKSGYKGVYWNKKYKKWQAEIGKNKKHHYLGRFDDPKEASNVYNKTALELFGEFARYGEYHE